MISKMSSVYSICILFAFSLLLTVSADEKEAKDKVDVDSEKLEYAKGSLCRYCDYCKFCKLCDEDCPCETSPTKPNCKMCKYCKYCYVCKACDAVCQPGGILDTVTGAIVNALPSFSDEDIQEVDEDIDSVKSWIDNKKDEL